VRPAGRRPGVGEPGVPGSGIGPRTRARPAVGAKAGGIGSVFVNGSLPICLFPRGARVSAQRTSVKNLRVTGRAVTPASIRTRVLRYRDSAHPCAAGPCGGFWSVRPAGGDGVSVAGSIVDRDDSGAKVKRSILRVIGTKFYFALIWGRGRGGRGRHRSPRFLSR